MLPRSEAYDDAIRNGGKVVVEADIIQDFVTIRSGVPILEGEVTVDQDADVRRSLRATFIDEDGSLTPGDPPSGTDLLAPFGSELLVRVGFEGPQFAGGRELLPVGVFRIETTTIEDHAIHIEAEDRSYVIAQRLFERPYAVVPGVNLVQAVVVLIDSRYPNLRYSAEPSSATTVGPDDPLSVVSPPVIHYVPLIVFLEGEQDGNPWQNAVDMLKSGGLEGFFDAEGTMVIRRVPDVALEVPTWIHLPNAEAIIVSTSRTISSRDAKNVAIATGEGTGIIEPVRQVREILDVNSPIHPQSPFGRRPTFVRAATIANVGQAGVAAEAELATKAGSSEILGFSAVGHPAHDAGDVVHVTNTERGIDVSTVISSFTLDLTLQSESVYTTVAQRII